jgi:Flp pilus assembly protein protease CpaA
MKFLFDLMPFLILPNVFIVIATLCSTSESFKTSRIPFFISLAIFVASLITLVITGATLMTLMCMLSSFLTMALRLYIVRKEKFSAFKNQVILALWKEDSEERIAA